MFIELGNYYLNHRNYTTVKKSNFKCRVDNSPSFKSHQISFTFDLFCKSRFTYEHPFKMLRTEGLPVYKNVDQYITVFHVKAMKYDLNNTF